MHVGNVQSIFLEVGIGVWGVVSPSCCLQLAFLLLDSTFMLNVAQNLSVNPLLQYGLSYIIGKLRVSSF